MFEAQQIGGRTFAVSPLLTPHLLFVLPRGNISSAMPQQPASNPPIQNDDLPSRLAEIARRNSGLAEEPPAPSARLPEAAVRERWKRWLRFGGGYDWRVLRKRMKAEGLRPASLYQPRLAPDPLPAWCETLGAILHNARALGREPDPWSAATALLPPESGKLAFAQVLVPCLQVARARLASLPSSPNLPFPDHLLTPAARHDLERALLTRLGEVAGPVLMEMFSARRQVNPMLLKLFGRIPAPGGDGQLPDRDYRAFVAAQLADAYGELGRRWPVLARLLAVVVDLWVSATREFAQRLEADHRTLRQRFFGETDPVATLSPVPVTGIDSTLSDPHGGGRTVLQIRFADGRRIIYKPRAMAMEAAFSDTVAWLNGQLTLSGQGHRRHRVARVWAREGYGWMEWIAATPLAPEEGAAYYWRLGSLIALFRAMNGADMHHENIVAAGACPVFVDVECLLHPSPQPFLEMPAIAAHSPGVSPRAVLGLGILPFYGCSEDQRFYNLGALGGPPNGAGPSSPRFVHPNSDWMALQSCPDPINTHHYPRHAEGWCNALDYREELAAGFAATLHQVYRQGDWLLHHKASPWAALRHAEGRHLARNTWHYGVLLGGAVSPEALTDGVMFDLTFEALHRHLAEFSPGFRAMARAERRDLRQLDVPRFGFGADSGALLDAQGRPIAPLHRQTPHATLCQDLLALTPAQIDWEAALLAAVLRPNGADWWGSGPESLWTHRLESPGGPPLWLGLAQVSEGTACQPLGIGLYQGMGGVALALAAAGRAAGDAVATRAAMAELRHSLQRLPPGARGSGDGERQFPLVGSLQPSFQAGLPGLGYDQGAAGLLFAMHHCARLAEEPGLGTEALALAGDWFGRERLSHLLCHDHQLDLLSGTAGLLLVLLQLAGDDPHHPLLAAARQCGDHLLQRARPAGRGLVWVRTGRHGLSGLSHGGSGFAVALAALYRATGHHPYRQAAFAALAYEATLYNPAQGNWRDLRQFTGEDITRVGYHGLSWCHGAPGIALARAALLHLLANQLTPGEAASLQHPLEIALTTTEAILRQDDGCQLDDLCCGSAGCIDILLECGRLLDRPDLLASAREHAQRRRQDWTGDPPGSPRFWYTGHGLAGHDLSLFKGLAGWTYLEARLAAPEIIPCVLLPLPLASGNRLPT